MSSAIMKLRNLPVSRQLRGFTRSRYNSTAAAANKDKFKVLVIGGGSAGTAVSNQIYNRFKAAGSSLADGDVAVLDAAEFHHYQPGWTLVGAGLRDKESLRKPLASLIPEHITHIPESVATFQPASSTVTTNSGRTLAYDILVVAAGLQINWSAVRGLPEALADPNSGVSSIYSYETADKVWRDIDTLRNGKAIFTQPAGIIKCAGAPQKIMWMAWDRYRRTLRGDIVAVEFWTATPTMFAVKKYSDALDALRLERGIPAHFQHNLIAVDPVRHVATFKNLAAPAGSDDAVDSDLVETDYTILHATPPQGPLSVLARSPLADEAGWISVDDATLQHKNQEYKNVFALGDCSSLPTSKTAAAITQQAPVVAENVYHLLEKGEISAARYDGYTSCPLLTGYGQLMLAEFKYGLIPKETFAGILGDQAKPRRIFYHLKKDLFPSIYYSRFVKGEWFGPNGIRRPSFS